MPIYNSRDLIPFVNMLEQKINELNESINEWNINKHVLLHAASRVDSNYSTAMLALVRADEAMAEIGTAVFKSNATRGKRLEDTLNQLKNEIFELASNHLENSGGGGGELTSGVFYDELNNAIASVDVTIEEGLKLDYRLREIQKMAEKGGSLSGKDLIVPYKYELNNVDELTVIIPEQEGVHFLDGDVTVLNDNYIPILNEDGQIITGNINEEGEIILSDLPSSEKIFLYFPVKMEFKDVPEEFLYLFMEQVIQKNSKLMELVLQFEDKIADLVNDIEYMKGVDWTPDFSIMKNHQELVKESITPKGFDIEVKDGKAVVTFSYNDHPHLSHFILEKWDEESKKFVPYDGKNGIINK